MQGEVPRPVPRPIGVAHTPAYPQADLTTCDREPIHVPGAIQPHGVLLALDATTLQVVVASANTGAMLGVPAEEAIGQDLVALVGVHAAALVEARAAEATPSSEPLVLRPSGPLGLSGADVGAGLLQDRDVDAHLTRSGTRLVLELEPLVGSRGTLSYAAARGALGRLAGASTTEEMAARLAAEVRAVLGYDRVMVYRFDAQWNGEVVAEEVREDLNSFHGLHYPATDIPAQARRLYTLNLTRLIADIAYVPVPLVPLLDPATDAPLDLSFARLRSVSPIHVEYLGNMGVSGSMSISLVVDDQLWGLIACHHYSGPHRPSQDACAAAELLGQVASQLIAERVRSERREAQLRARTMLAGMVSRITASPRHPLRTLVEDPELLGLMGATGVAVSHDGELFHAGVVPSDDDLVAISAALADKDDYATYTDAVGSLDPALGGRPEIDRVAAGALRIGAERDRWVLWLRPEQEQTVDWGGDPRNKRYAAEEGPEVRLSPRKSFDKWREVVRGRSEQWESWQVEAADALGVHVTGLMLARAREHVLVAESVQRSVVLAESPRFDGLEVAARYLPAATLQMGGDWWDAFEVAPGRVALVLGDVAGHGVDAASAMIQLRTALRAYLYAGVGPAAALDQLDQLMQRLLVDQVATAVVAIVEPTTGAVEITAAGHLPPLLATADGTRDLVVETRALLGFDDAAPARTTSLVLEPGQTLVLFSDGLVERRGVDTGERTTVVRGLAAYDPDGDLDAWVERVLAIRDGTEDDDTTVLAVRLPRR